MFEISPAKRLTVVVGEQDSHGHHSTALEIVHRAQANGLAGATLWRGIEGFGASSHIHASRLLSLANDLPICVVVVDSAERIAAFVEELADILTGGLVTLEDVERVTYHEPGEV